MIDDNINIMKTFSDYSEEVPIQFVKIHIPSNHLWINQKIKDVHILPELALVLILRGKKRIIRKDKTVIKEHDIFVINQL